MDEDKLLDKIVEELRSDIKGTIKESINDSLEEMLKPIHKKIDALQVVVDHNLAEANEVGRDISDIKVIESEQAASIRELLLGVHKQSRNIVQKVVTTVETQIEGIADKVEEAVAPTIENTMDKFVETNGKKMRVKKNRYRFRLPFFMKN